MAVECEGADRGKREFRGIRLVNKDVAEFAARPGSVRAGHKCWPWAGT